MQRLQYNYGLVRLSLFAQDDRHKCTLSIFSFFNKSNPLTHGYIVWFLDSETTEDESTKACVSAQENENGNMKKFPRLVDHMISFRFQFYTEISSTRISNRSAEQILTMLS